MSKTSKGSDINSALEIVINCTDGNVANLILIEISDRLVRFFKIVQPKHLTSSNSKQLVNSTVEIDPEHGPLI
jgi:hypothetical protein